MQLTWLSPYFQSLPLLPASNWRPSSCCPAADSQVGGLVYILGLLGPLKQTLLRDWLFFPLPQPPQVFTARGFKALIPSPGTLGCIVFIACSPVVPFFIFMLM